MHPIARKKLLQFAATHPDADGPLTRWFKLTRAAEWTRFADMRADFPHADQVEKFVVFNIGGNKYRLIVEINYRTPKIFIRHVLTHEEYDEGDWKT